MYIQLLLLLALVAVASGWLIWRRWSRRQQMPCPAWMAWILDNPLTSLVASAERTLDRLGLRAGERLLDVGCGPGRLAIPAAHRVGPAGEVFAIDIQAGMLKRLRARLKRANAENVVVRMADITADGELPAHHFDRALLVTVLGELPDRSAGLGNIYRALKSGGVLSVTEIFPDPHYQPRSTVLNLCQDAGFVPTDYWGTALAFTQNFTKP